MSFATWLSAVVTDAKASRNQSGLSLPGTFETDIATEVQDFVLGMMYKPLPSGGARTGILNSTFEADVANQLTGARRNDCVRFVNSLIDLYVDVDRDPQIANPGPTFTSITANTGTTAGGTTVVIAGKNFRTGVTVSIGGAPATSIVRNSDRKITCVTPARTAGAKDVVVTNTDSTSATGTGAFTYS